jgi:hypothetical protein
MLTAPAQLTGAHTVSLPTQAPNGTGKTVMVNHCSNPQCAKPLHYLREGRIFVFDVPLQNLGGEGKRTRRIEHYWLCGACLQTMLLEQSTEGIRVIPRPATGFRGEVAAS